MQVTSTGSVRVDLLGGTIDLEPINLILPNVTTLNVATSLQAKVLIETNKTETILIYSRDYNSEYVFKSEDITDVNLYQSDFFGPMTFVMQILDLFGFRKGLKIELSSGAPAGSGLGGSSAMGMTLYKALKKLKNESYEVHDAVKKIKGVEGRILNQGVPGYQDYYPAMLGGVLSLTAKPGEICFEQLYTQDLKDFLERHITLVYSGISRQSGINNWDVYKGFFDKNPVVRQGLSTIADLSYKAYQAIKDKDYTLLLDLISEEGESRKILAPGIVPSEVESFSMNLKQEFSQIGIKMCGAGGGGCFILTHKEMDRVKIHQRIEQSQMQVLPFEILSPLKIEQ